MRIAYFTHSLRSCWNHGDAHFLRGVRRASMARGHEVTAYEPAEPWSVQTLVADGGARALDSWRAVYPELHTTVMPLDADLDAMRGSADLVIVHEWNELALVAAIGAARRRGGRFRLPFYGMHHRAVSEPEAMRCYDLSVYDGVLAFEVTLADVYCGWGWDARVFVWHEAADTTWVRPPATDAPRHGAVWVGNWGDGERTAALPAFLFRPV